MNQRVKRHSKVISTRSKRTKSRNSMIAAGVVALVLLIGAGVLQRPAPQPAIVNAISEAETEGDLFPLADSNKPLKGGHDMDKIPSQIPQPEKSDDASTPKVDIPTTNFDLGKIEPSSTVAVVYSIQNVGTENLVLSNLVTSCGCTTAELSTSIIPPGQRADLKVVFDPGFHLTIGPVTRLVWMMTNDPTQPWIELTLNADVLEES